MNIQIKLQSGTYGIKTDAQAMTCSYNYIGEDKDGNPKEASVNIGYYGPGQIDQAINRIIAEELNKNQDVVNLRQFLVVYKSIHEIIAPRLSELKEEIKLNRLATN